MGLKIFAFWNWIRCMSQCTVVSNFNLVYDLIFTATKNGHYTYTMMPYTSCIPVKNSHLWSHTNSYTVWSVDSWIYVYSLYTKKSLIPTHTLIKFCTRSYTISLPFCKIQSDIFSYFWSFLWIKLISIYQIGICIRNFSIYQSHSK